MRPMTPQLIELRRLAGRLAASWSTSPQPPVVLLGGSVAAGRADRYSDLDLFFIARQVPAPAERQAWLATLRDAGSVAWLNQAVSTGGWADTCRIGGRDVTVTWRAAADLEAGLRAVVAATSLDPDHEIAYAHEPLQAEVLLDPCGVVPAWRATLRPYPPVRAEAVRRRAAGHLAAAAEADDLAAAGRLWGAVVARLQAACAAAGCYWPGPKRVAELADGGEGLRRALGQALTTLAEPGPPAARLRRLGLEALDELGPAAPVTPDALPPVAPQSLLNAGCDAVGGRMLVAAARRDWLGCAHYADRCLDAFTRLGGDPAELLPVFVAGFDPTRLESVRRRLVAVWERWLPKLVAGGLDPSYALAALAVGRV